MQKIIDFLKKWWQLFLIVAVCVFFGKRLSLIRKLNITLVVLLAISIVFLIIMKLFRGEGKELEED